MSRGQKKEDPYEKEVKTSRGKVVRVKGGSSEKKEACERGAGKDEENSICRKKGGRDADRIEGNKQKKSPEKGESFA